MTSLPLSISLCTLPPQLTNSAQLSPSSAHNHHSSLLTPSLSQATQYYSLDASLGSDLSFLLNQTSLFSPDQLVAIAEDLVPSAALEVSVQFPYNPGISLRHESLVYGEYFILPYFHSHSRCGSKPCITCCSFRWGIWLPWRYGPS